MMNANSNNGATNNNTNNNNLGGNVIMMNGRIENLGAFAVAVKEALEVVYPDNQVTINEVSKNNGVTYTGIVIKAADINIAPTIYLDQMYQEYCDGATLGELVNKIIRIYEENRVHQDFDVSSITDFDKVKDRVCMKLINAERNAGLLEVAPHKMFKYLAVVFFVALSCDEGGSASVTIKNDMMKVWSIDDVDYIYNLAKENTQRMFRGTVQNMFEVLMGMASNHPDDIDADVLDAIFDMDVYEDAMAPMFVASNRQKINGSCVMLYDGLLRTFAEKIGDDFYILPSSVHEIIFIPCNGMDPDNLLMMVGEVNSTDVSESDYLSDHIYKYDAGTDSLEMI